MKYPATSLSYTNRKQMDAIRIVLDSGWFILGEQVKLFEKEFAEYCSGGAAVGVGSGTDAITIALEALGVGAGDEVICPAFGPVPILVGIEQSGARPVLVDVEYATGNINPDHIQSHVTHNTKAILAVHLYGQPAELARLSVLCDKNELLLIEDCSQAHGARYNGVVVGGWGDASVFSFYPTKNLGGIGDGGMVIFRDPAHAELAVGLRQYGWIDGRADSKFRGRNSRLDEIQAATLRHKLPLLDVHNDWRHHLGKTYSSGIVANLLDQMLTPINFRNTTNVYHQYVVKVQNDKRDWLYRGLLARGVQAQIHYPIPLHLQTAYRDLGYKAGDFPIAERLAREVLSLPIHQDMPIQHVFDICDIIREIYDV